MIAHFSMSNAAAREHDDAPPAYMRLLAFSICGTGPAPGKDWPPGKQHRPDACSACHAASFRKRSNQGGVCGC